MREAQLIDEQCYEQWLALFADDGHYWAPLSPDQTEPNLQPSLAYEDPLLLKIRVERLRHPQAHSQRPPSRCIHVLQASQFTGRHGQIVTLRTPFSYTEQRADRQIMLTGVARHHLTQIGGTLRIKLKRVDLLGAASALPMIQLFP